MPALGEVFTHKYFLPRRDETVTRVLSLSKRRLVFLSLQTSISCSKDLIAFCLVSPRVM